MGTMPASQGRAQPTRQGHLFEDVPGDKPSRKRIVFERYTGKDRRLDRLLPLLPECHHYCEPFGGSVAVLLNRPPSPVETYNDIDSEVVNFFHMLRDHKDELLYQIGKTAPSKEEFLEAIETKGKERNHLSDLERARRFFVRAQQVRMGLAQARSLEMTDQEHVQLSRVLHAVKGKVAVSGSLCDLMCELYKDWQVHLDKPWKAISVKKERQEALWTNY